MDGQDEAIRRESEAAFDGLMRRYGDRLTPEMAAGLKRAVEAVVTTVTAVRAVKLAPGEAPLRSFPPLPEGE